MNKIGTKCSSIALGNDCSNMKCMFEKKWESSHGMELINCYSEVCGCSSG